jgi:23S rRNA (cytosine1962-C5)-methyltransferase
VSGVVETTAVRGSVLLKRREEKRVLGGHTWVFSNEIERIDGEPPAGAAVAVKRSDGRLVGYGFFNPSSLIAVRIFSRRDPVMDRPLLVERLKHAAGLREVLYPGSTAWRLAHGESDGLPGLIVDRYDTVFVIQTLALGMDLLKDLLRDVLVQDFGATAVVERNESALRVYEGLPQRSGLLAGEIDGVVVIEEGGLKFEVDPVRGHKTGFYFDQRENRLAIRRFASTARALDVYCNDGAFALHAAKAGAGEVLGVDVSADSIARAERNAALNGLADRVRFEAAGAPEALEALHQGGERFGLVVLDPPSFTRSRKNVPQAKRAYVDVNRRAIRVLSRGGFLATASCSHHITDETFLECVHEAALSVDRWPRLLEWRSQAPDHPILPAMPETRYLKFALLQID